LPQIADSNGWRNIFVLVNQAEERSTQPYSTRVAGVYSANHNSTTSLSS
jgi:hypothetical protein